MFVELSWFFVMHGMGLRPQSYDPLVDASDWQEVIKVMQGMRQKVAADAAAAPTHDSFFPEKPEATAPARGWVQRAGGLTVGNRRRHADPHTVPAPF